VAIAPDGTWLATGDSDGTVRIWDPATGRQRATLTGHTGSVTAVAIAPDGTWLATASGAWLATASGDWLATGDSDRSVRIWDPATGRQRATLGHTCSVTAVAIAPDGTWLATASRDGTVRIWDRATAGIRAAMRIDRPLVDCAWSPSGQSLVVAGDAGLYHFTFHVANSSIII
jgi:WD40 repeat protein